LTKEEIVGVDTGIEFSVGLEASRVQIRASFAFAGIGDTVSIGAFSTLATSPSSL
jgi:hypothetical protein